MMKKASNIEGKNCIKDRNGKTVIVKDGRKSMEEAHEVSHEWNGECRRG